MGENTPKRVWIRRVEDSKGAVITTTVLPKWTLSPAKDWGIQEVSEEGDEIRVTRGGSDWEKWASGFNKKRPEGKYRV